MAAKLSFQSPIIEFTGSTLGSLKIQITEEARRVLEVASDGERSSFMEDCVNRLFDQMESLIYFGITTKGINPPKSSKPASKLVYLMKHISPIFGKQKGSRKPVQLLHELKDSEDVDSWVRKQLGNMPLLVTDKENAYVIVGKSILFSTEITKLGEAIVGYLASFYLLDYDYPKQSEMGMNILQYYIFEDKKVPEDIAFAFKSQLTHYKEYVAGSV